MQTNRDTQSESPCLTLRTGGPDQTHGLGKVIAQVIQAGDTVCISGELGAGKSELCRAIIRQMMGDPEFEVPSPSYTLVNVYDHPDAQIWHADLYRVGDESELEEIGLHDAAEDSVVLVEWPDRWVQPPGRRLDVTLTSVANETREFVFQPVGPGWDAILNELKAFA